MRQLTGETEGEDEDGGEEEEDMEEEELLPTPVLHRWPGLFKRLQRQRLKPGHLIQRKWLKKGKDQGFVTLPFLSALRSVVPDPDVNICLISRRELSDEVAKEWQAQLDEIPLFDISGEVSTPRDLDPLEPHFETPLDEPLPSEQELQAELRKEGVLDRMHNKTGRDMDELEFLASKYREESPGGGAVVLRKIVERLPEELLTEEYTELIRRTVTEVLKLLWVVHTASDSTRLRWRLACTDDELEAPTPTTSLRGYFLLAGEPLEFVPQQYVDAKKVSAEEFLSDEQIRRMDSEEWARSLSVTGTNITEALKRVPPGWTVILKGDSWPSMEGRGARYRLPQSGKRLHVEIDFLEGAEEESAKEPEDAESSDSADDQDSDVPPFLQWLGPIAGTAAVLYGVAQKTVLFKAGQKGRRQLNELLKGAQGGEEKPDKVTQRELKRFEESLWTDFELADGAPVVLVLGSESETGQVISRKLVASGCHCVLVKNGKTEKKTSKVMSQGATILNLTLNLDETNFDDFNIPDSLYDAVAGVDKLVICDSDGPGSLPGQVVTNVLTAWQHYRQDFAEYQRAYSSKVRIFNFNRETDFDLWDLERQAPSDMCYGTQRAGWTRSSWGSALLIGQFFEPLAQTQLKSPILKLNFKRFGGLLLHVYNQAVDRKYCWFLRTADFEKTRVQHEFEFECKGSSWHWVRMPFNAFKPIRTDGVLIPEDQVGNYPFNREDVVQMGLVVRTNGEAEVYEDERLHYFSLQLNAVKVYRNQSEPQVVYVGRQPDGDAAKTLAVSVVDDKPASLTDENETDLLDLYAAVEGQDDAKSKQEQEAADDIAELVSDTDVRMKFDQESTVRQRNPVPAIAAVVRSGLAFTIFKVADVNDEPGGKYPVALQQTPVDMPHLSPHVTHLNAVSRGDIAAIATSALSEPCCAQHRNKLYSSGRRENPFETTSTK